MSTRASTRLAGWAGELARKQGRLVVEGGAVLGLLEPLGVLRGVRRRANEADALLHASEQAEWTRWMVGCAALVIGEGDPGCVRFRQ